MERRDRFPNPPVPFLSAMSEAGIVAEVFVVGLAPAERMMGELEVRCGPSFCKDGAAHSRAEGQHDLDATTSDDAEALHLGVVEQTSRLSKETRDLRFQRKITPGRRSQIRRSEDLASPDHARKSDGDALESRQRDDQFADELQQKLWRTRMRGLHANPVRQHATGTVEYRRLDSGSADIDPESTWTLLYRRGRLGLPHSHVSSTSTPVDRPTMTAEAKPRKRPVSTTPTMLASWASSVAGLDSISIAQSAM